MRKYIVLVCFFLFTEYTMADDGLWKRIFIFQSEMAKKGNVEAIYKLGEMYEEGLGVARNISQAKKFYVDAAKQGHSKARKKLAYIQ